MKPYAYDRRDEHGSIQLHQGDEVPRVRADEKLIPLYSAEQVAELVAENAALKSAAEFATAPDMWVEQADGMLEYRYHEWYVDVLKAAMETPATDAYLSQLRNEARAEGAEYCVRALVTSDDDDFTDAPNICAELARQLREGKAGEVGSEK